MKKNTLNINITGETKAKLETIHERTHESYTKTIRNLLDNSPDPIDIINNGFEGFKNKLGDDDLKGTLERLRVITIKCYKNRNDLGKTDEILENVMKELGELNE